LLEFNPCEPIPVLDYVQQLLDEPSHARNALPFPVATLATLNPSVRMYKVRTDIPRIGQTQVDIGQLNCQKKESVNVRAHYAQAQMLPLMLTLEGRKVVD